jgi:hypothetical protein
MYVCMYMCIESPSSKSESLPLHDLLLLILSESKVRPPKRDRETSGAGSFPMLSNHTYVCTYYDYETGRGKMGTGNEIKVFVPLSSF